MPFAVKSCVGDQGVDRRQRRDAEEGGYVNFAVIHQQHRVFAALNMNIQEWDPSVADFPSGEAFMAFVQRAQALSFYDTGVEVNEEDEIVTLITCDRSYAGADGRMVVMAVKQ